VTYFTFWLSRNSFSIFAGTMDLLSLVDRYFPLYRARHVPGGSGSGPGPPQG
jgi:hypothetical protein